jgi:hypothetical protein
LSELALVCRTVTVAPGRRPDLRTRLRALADRVPRVADDPYRVTLNRLGIDAPTPAEAALRARLVAGGYRSRGALPDALLIATIETGVGVWATDDPGPLRIEGGEVVGAALRVPLFTAPPRPSSPRVIVYGVVAAGVPAGVVEEAVLIAARTLDPSTRG